MSSDWVCCDACENWVHFSCDKRGGIGAFKDYAQGSGRVYVCPACTREPGQAGAGAGAGQEAEAAGAGKKQRTS